MPRTTFLPDQLARACCYFAAAGVPLYFTGLTATAYEPDKSSLVRVIAAIALCAWLASAPGGLRARVRHVSGILTAACALFAAFAVATVLSIDRNLSLWGSSARGEGLWTMAAYLVLLLVAATRF